MSSNTEVGLDLYDLVMLYCIVHHRDKAYLEMKAKYPDLGDYEINQAIGGVGITRIWGNKTFMEDKTWEGKPIPAGTFNSLILNYHMGAPLLHHTQFYRLADKLADAGWLLGGELRFIYTREASDFVHDILDRRLPDDWPTFVPVMNGQVVDYDRIEPYLPSSLRRAIMI